MAARDQEDLPVAHDTTMVNQLYRLPIDTALGKELFPVMAVLLAHVLRVDRKTKEESA
jgi:type III secretion system FlhB-like substrate exporter